MRSRYVAFTQKNLAYIEKTMRGPARKTFNLEQTQLHLATIEWTGLTILATSTEETTATVTFEVTFRHQGRISKQRETSLFHKIQGTWYYVEALSLTLEDLPPLTNS